MNTVCTTTQIEIIEGNEASNGTRKPLCFRDGCCMPFLLSNILVPVLVND